MLTHTIRAFSLMGLLLIAHAIKPFSLGNVAAFTSQTFYSLSFVLPQTAVDRMEQAGELVARLGGSWGETGRWADKLVALRASFSPNDTTEAALLKVRVAGKRPVSARKIAQRTERNARSLQVRNENSGGAAPLPIIPGIEASLISGAALMSFSSFSSAASDSAQDVPEFLPLQQKLFNLDCERGIGFEKQRWLPEDALLKLQEAQLPTLKVRVSTQRASQGAACPQAGKASTSSAGNNKQSC
jgi:hypothetical protein